VTLTYVRSIQAVSFGAADAKFEYAASYFAVEVGSDRN
jgi:hypothetical protein